MWPLTYPLPLERAGLPEVEAVVSGPVFRGGSAMAAFVQATAAVAEPAMVATGIVTSEDMAEFDRLCADPSVVDYSAITLAGRGRRAP